ncbi:MAG: protein kinase, partial [Ilumatobacter sp.]|nr:protein kinase [Ilumatobacter sp.]
DLVATTAEALHYAHKQGLVHRDVKPGNILIGNDGKPYIVDFGLALREENIGKGPKFAGTPAYMSPEQAILNQLDVDTRTVVFYGKNISSQINRGRRDIKITVGQGCFDLQVVSIGRRQLQSFVIAGSIIMPDRYLLIKSHQTTNRVNTDGEIIRSTSRTGHGVAGLIKHNFNSSTAICGMRIKTRTHVGSIQHKRVSHRKFPVCTSVDRSGKIIGKVSRVIDGQISFIDQKGVCRQDRFCVDARPVVFDGEHTRSQIDGGRSGIQIAVGQSRFDLEIVGVVRGQTQRFVMTAGRHVVPDRLQLIKGHLTTDRIDADGEIITGAHRTGHRVAGLAQRDFRSPAAVRGVRMQSGTDAASVQFQ